MTNQQNRDAWAELEDMGYLATRTLTTPATADEIISDIHHVVEKYAHEPLPVFLLNHQAFGRISRTRPWPWAPGDLPIFDDRMKEQ